MKNHVSIWSFLCILLALLSSNACTICANAMQTIDGVPFVDNEENYFYSYAPSAIPRLVGVENPLFSMEASALTGLRTTHGTGKTFYGSRFSDNGAVYYCGKLKTYYDNNASAGICVWNPATNTFDAKHRTYFRSDEFILSEMIPTQQFRDSTLYYGFINGRDTGGTTGSIQFWYLNYDA